MNSVQRFIHIHRTRSRLLDCFRSAGIFFTRSRGDRTQYIYPRIHSIKPKHEENKTEIVFTLRNGMDPKEIKKKEYVFRQYFSKQIDIKGDLKHFTLFVYHKPLPAEYTYSYDEFYPVIKDMALPFILGRNINGSMEVIDLLKVPHPLVAGETGSGKSSLLRVVLTTLIKLKRPEELEIYLADCKRSEFSIFRNAEMVKCVYHKPADIRRMLKGIAAEMDRRSALTEMYQVPHIDELPPAHRLNYILVCIDEFVRLKSDKEIQNILIDLVSIGRSLGVICLLSMQRPSGDILDTSVRAQLTARIAFQVEDSINARIIGVEGAEKIKEPGTMRAKIKGELKEIKAPFLEMEAAKELLSPYCIAKGPVKPIKDENISPAPLVLEKEKTADRGKMVKPHGDINLFMED
ncbi:FtsK/SpoIIIE domain-containing protein [Bacillus infantis]|uniref:FtsK/SpoIIIE domain-containing protein n=1 Tax=Bacillus infantis TaxID=324767 RepID=UPI00321B4A64